MACASIKHLKIHETLPILSSPPPTTQDMSWLASGLQPYLQQPGVWQATEKWLEILDNCLRIVYAYQSTHVFWSQHNSSNNNNNNFYMIHVQGTVLNILTII